MSVKPETLNLMENKMGKNLQGINVGKVLLDRTVTAQEITRLYKCDYIKLKRFSTAKKRSSILKRQTSEGKYFSVSSSDSGLISRQI